MTLTSLTIGISLVPAALLDFTDRVCSRLETFEGITAAYAGGGGHLSYLLFLAVIQLAISVLVDKDGPAGEFFFTCPLLIAVFLGVAVILAVAVGVRPLVAEDGAALVVVEIDSDVFRAQFDLLRRLLVGAVPTFL